MIHTKVVVAAVIVIGSITCGMLPANAKSETQCSKVAGQKNCITVTESGKGNFRVSVEWIYDQARNVAVPRPVKRTVWGMNVICKLRLGRVDIVTFYDSSNKVVPLTASMLSNVSRGLQQNAAPKLVQVLCG